MRDQYPDPASLGLRIPAMLDKEKFCTGFRHGLKGAQLSWAEHLKRSFLEGHRSAKLFLRDYRRRQGILEFPMRARCKMKVV